MWTKRGRKGVRDLFNCFVSRALQRVEEKSSAATAGEMSPWISLLFKGEIN